MLAFGIRYLNGFVAAAEPDSHERAEWPPHPGRVFMALAATHFQTGCEPAERDALIWLGGGGEGAAPLGPPPPLVQMWVASDGELEQPNWVPDDRRPTVPLRLPGPGTLADLERRFN